MPLGHHNQKLRYFLIVIETYVYMFDGHAKFDHRSGQYQKERVLRSDRESERGGGRKVGGWEAAKMLDNGKCQNLLG